jgi:PST family polysaccharide transporter
MTFGINFAGLAILARVLTPTDFGAYALAQSYSIIVNALGAFPFGQAVVQSPGHDETADAALIMGSLVRVGLLLVSFPVCLLLNHLNGFTVAALFGGLSLLQIVDGARSAMMAPLERDFRYRSVAGLSALAAAGAAGTSIGLGYLGYGAYALFARDALGIILVTATLLLLGRRLALPTGARLERRAALRVWQVGKQLFWIRSLEMVLSRIDRVLLGNTLDLSSLGYFNQARYLATLPQAAMAPGNLQVAVATYCRLKDDPVRLAKAFDTVQYFVLRVVAIAGILVALWPEDVLRALYGTRWVAAAPTLRILGLYVILFPALESYRSLFTALEDWRVLRRVVVLQGAALLGLLFILLPVFGILGAAAATVAVPIVGLAVLVVSSRKVLSRHSHGSLAPVLMAAVVSFAFGWLALPPWPSALLRMTILMMFYLFAIIAIERKTLNERLQYLRRSFERG